MAADGVDTGQAIAALIDRIGRMTRALQYAHGLNPAQWESLRFIASANQFSRTPGALATFLGTTKGTASQTLIALEKKGYVARVADRRDRRVTHLEVTAAGTDMLARDPLADIDGIARTLPAATAAVLADGLAAVCRELQVQNCGSEFGVCQACGHFQGPGDGGGKMCGLKHAELPSEEASKLCVNFLAEPSRAGAGER